LTIAIREVLLTMKDDILPKEARVSREIDPEALLGKISWSQIYGNDHPVELEIGIGKGLFMASAAKARPEHNFFGIEYARKYFRMAQGRIEKRPLPNVRLVCTEAFSFIEDHIPDGSLHTVHLYYPDPWPKARHHKRRIFTPVFLKLVHDKLIPGGTFLVATDHADYWEWMDERLKAQDFLIPCDRLPEPIEGTKGLTSFQIKYEKEGRSIYRAGYQKPA
jgi:tRNA (guanine-N7-)-methyltransferase